MTLQTVSTGLAMTHAEPVMLVSAVIWCQENQFLHLGIHLARRPEDNTITFPSEIPAILLQP